MREISLKDVENGDSKEIKKLVDAVNKLAKGQKAPVVNNNVPVPVVTNEINPVIEANNVPYLFEVTQRDDNGQIKRALFTPYEPK